MTAGKFSLKLDRSKVIQRHDRRNRTLLMRTGGYSRALMRNQMKRAPKKFPSNSKPGEAPRTREGSLKRNISFAFDSAGPSVVTGPDTFATKTKPRGGKTGAEMLNEGGFASLTKPGGEKVAATFKPRPFTVKPLEGGAEFLATQTAKTPL